MILVTNLVHRFGICHRNGKYIIKGVTSKAVSLLNKAGVGILFLKSLYIHVEMHISVDAQFKLMALEGRMGHTIVTQLEVNAASVL